MAFSLIRTSLRRSPHLLNLNRGPIARSQDLYPSLLQRRTISDVDDAIDELDVLEYSRNPWETLPRSIVEAAPYVNAHLREANNTQWGFVIYRGTYTDDKAWSRFLTLLHKHSDIQLSARPLLRSKLKYIIRDKKEINDQSSKAVVREHFRRWIVDTYPSQDIKISDFKGRDRPDIGGKWEAQDVSSYPRWRYCVHVDRQALFSALDNKSWMRYVEQGWTALQTTTNHEALPAFDRNAWRWSESPKPPYVNVIDSLKAGEAEHISHTGTHMEISRIPLMVSPACTGQTTVGLDTTKAG